MPSNCAWVSWRLWGATTQRSPLTRSGQRWSPTPGLTPRRRPKRRWPARVGDGHHRRRPNLIRRDFPNSPLYRRVERRHIGRRAVRPWWPSLEHPPRTPRRTAANWCRGLAAVHDPMARVANPGLSWWHDQGGGGRRWHVDQDISWPALPVGPRERAIVHAKARLSLNARITRKTDATAK